MKNLPKGGACLLRLQQRSGPAGDCASRAAGLLEKSEGVNDVPFRPGVVRRLRAPANQEVRHQPRHERVLATLNQERLVTRRWRHIFKPFRRLASEYEHSVEPALQLIKSGF